jgi:hypothetical protein
MFRRLAHAQGMSDDEVSLLIQSWQFDTFRHMRHSWTELYRYLQSEGIDENKLLEPEGATIVNNFLAAYVKAGRKSVEAVFTHCTMLRRILCGDGSVTTSHLRRAVRRQKPEKELKFDEIWDLKQLMNYIRQTWSMNDLLSNEELLTKTLALTMIFSGCRLVDLTRMKIRQDSISPEGVVIEMCIKTHLEVASMTYIQPTGDIGLCPYESIVCWFGSCTRPDGLLFVDPDSGEPLVSRKIGDRLQRLLTNAGIHGYPPYSIKYAVVSFLFNRGVEESRVNAFGRWSPTSHIATRHYWIGRGKDTWLGHLIADEARSPTGSRGSSGNTAEVVGPTTQASGLAAALLE